MESGVIKVDSKRLAEEWANNFTMEELDERYLIGLQIREEMQLKNFASQLLNA